MHIETYIKQWETATGYKVQPKAFKSVKAYKKYWKKLVKIVIS